MFSDVQKIMNYYQEVLDDDITVASKNLFFQYGVLEFAFTNRSATAQVVIDIYEFSCRKVASATDLISPDQLVGEMEADEELLTETVGVPLMLSLGNVGVTPFQIPSLCRNLKFGKKTSIMLQPSGSSKYVMARKKNRWLRGQQAADTASWVQPGWTEGCFFMFRGVPQSGNIAATITLDFASQRKYCWRASDAHAQNDYAYEVY